ncbi:MAG: hypothetical protein GXX84_06635 [Acidobacteria bacterium]|nr:hypothetical protein [Acidobacteriota bacterium]
MRPEYLLLVVLLFSAGCGGKSMRPGLAEDLIVRMPMEILEDDDIEVKKVTQVSGSQAIAETSLRAAFRLEKEGGKWVVREVRLGHGQWEKIENLSRALDLVKTEETKHMLERIAEAILKYRDAEGELPPYRDYVALSDLLSPSYLTPLIRLDAWRRPLGVEQLDPGVPVIVSAGPDGDFGTGDDIRRVVPR